MTAPDEAAQRAAVIAAARRWIGTPYRHGADKIRLGVDCAMLLIRVYADLGLIEDFDPRPYSPQWNLHRSDEIYLAQLFARGHEIAVPSPGDVVIWRVGRTWSHGGIVTDWAPGAKPPREMVIHAYASSGIVEESNAALGGPLASPKHPRRYFSYWGA